MLWWFLILWIVATIVALYLNHRIAVNNDEYDKSAEEYFNNIKKES